MLIPLLLVPVLGFGLVLALACFCKSDRPHRDRRSTPQPRTPRAPTTTVARKQRFDHAMMIADKSST
jgi:hypothetical protein